MLRILRELKSINPFKGIVGPQHARHALTLNTTYTQKVRNTFTVLNGSNSIKTRDGLKSFLLSIAAAPRFRTGLLDIIPFLGLDNVLAKLAKELWLFSYKYSELPFIIRVPAFLVLDLPTYAILTAIGAARLAMYAVRYVASLAIAAIAAVTIAPVVHGFATWAYNNLMKLVGKMVITSKDKTEQVSAAELRSSVVVGLAQFDYQGDSTAFLISRISDDNKTFEVVIPTEDMIKATHVSDANITANNKGMNALLQLDYDSMGTKIETKDKDEGTDHYGLHYGKSSSMTRV